MAESACLQCISWGFNWRNRAFQPFLTSNWHFWQMAQMSAKCLLSKTEKVQISAQMQIICALWSLCMDYKQNLMEMPGDSACSGAEVYNKNVSTWHHGYIYSAFKITWSGSCHKPFQCLDASIHQHCSSWWGWYAAGTCPRAPPCSSHPAVLFGDLLWQADAPRGLDEI